MVKTQAPNLEFSLSEQHLRDYKRRMRVSGRTTAIFAVVSSMFVLTGFIFQSGSFIGVAVVIALLSLVGLASVRSARNRLEWAKENLILVQGDTMAIGTTKLNRSGITSIRPKGIASGLPGIVVIRARKIGGGRVKYEIPVRLYQNREELLSILLAQKENSG